MKIGGFTFKGLKNTVYFCIDDFRFVVNKTIKYVESIFENLDADFDTAINVANQSHLLKEANLCSCVKGVNCFGDVLKLVFDYKDGLRYSIILYRDADGTVSYGYYRHDYVYLIDAETDKTLMDFFVATEEISIWYE